MKNSNGTVSLRNGAIQYPGLLTHIKEKFRPDTPLDNNLVPYIIMILCSVIDGAVFISLFQAISYEGPFMLGVQVAGCLFAYDVVPLYIGIQFRRVRQGLSRDKFIVYLALGVCALAIVMNVVLRILTIDQLAPDTATVSVNFSTANAAGTAEQGAQETGRNNSNIALTLFGIITPILTSVGSFFISYVTYNPLRIRQERQEIAMAQKQEEIRQLQALIDEYEGDPLWGEHMFDDDETKYNEMRRLLRAKVVNYCDYVRLRLEEHLANPTAISALSVETCDVLLNRLKREQDALLRSWDEEDAEEDKKRKKTAEKDALESETAEATVEYKDTTDPRRNVIQYRKTSEA